MPRLSKIGAAALAAFGWTSGASAVTASYLVVAGGGGSAGVQAGADTGSGGGGAGGFLAGTTSLSVSNSYTITVGAGGTAGSAGGANGSNGSASVFNAITAIGGGASRWSPGTGAAGGSGGGGAGGNPSVAGGAGTSGQGYAGGAGKTDFVNASGGGGGGGSASTGTDASGVNGGNGGSGTSSSISGSAVSYAGGGGGAGGRSNYTQGSGLNGGGNAGKPGTAGTANLGGGAGGSNGGTTGNYSDQPGANGGSGIVIISYPSPQKFGGGVVTTSGSNVIHTFTTSGTLTPISSLSASYLIVAGGGAGGPYDGGGGGAGGMQTGSGVVIDTNSTYLVTVGAGGAASSGTTTSNGNNGSNSLFSAYATASVGGGGGGSLNTSQSPNNTVGAAGGSGGGGSYGGTTWAGGAGTSGQGNTGGTGGGSSTNSAGGGGGAGAVGGNSVSNAQGGAGGIGLTSSISGTSTYYAGGGGGGNDYTSGLGSQQALGGLGGGGNSAYARANNGTAGTANTGGGGGGGVESARQGYAGGSGIVIISYAGSTQQMAGGTVTISGGNVIHTFTSSGYLTPLTLVNNSLRFRSSASAYLSRTPTATGNQQKFTFSTWFKLGISSVQVLFNQRTGTNFPLGSVQIYSGPRLEFTTYAVGPTQQCYFLTTQVFRDPAAWYHLTISVDTTQATASNRVKIYVNGNQVTAFDSVTYPSQNANLGMNTTDPMRLGADTANSSYYDGYMANVQFIDGQQLTPNSFGTFNSYGVWQPITYGGSYGTNGFYLPFSNTTSTTTLGYDFSPNGNNWTTNNISLTAGTTYDSMLDVPTLTSATAANYCVLNAVNKGSNINLTNGNLQYDNVTSDASVFGTIGMSSGKWYWEMTVTSAGCSCGISAGNLPSSAPGSSATGYAYNYDGRKVNNGSLSAYGASYAVGDVIGYAFDADAGTITCYKNNTSQGTMFSGLTSGPYFASAGNGGSGAAYNFGQQGFKYTPPSGFVALNTYNI